MGMGAEKSFEASEAREKGWSSVWGTGKRVEQQKDLM